MSEQKRKILIVEDEESIRFLLKQNLEFEGYEVLETIDGQAGLNAALECEPDLIVLDLMLPQMSGMEVCKRLRSTGNVTPIIMLTAKGQQIDKVLGLKAGADDYLTKPFDILELSARIEALLRRSGMQKKLGKSYQINNLEIDFTAGVIRNGKEEMALTKVESQLLKYFVRNEGKVMSRESIMQDVWGHDYLLSTRTIDTHVTHLRQKIETNPSKPRHIVTVHRVGYKFVR